MTLRIGSLFTGIGGFDLGFEQKKGFKIVWQVEKDKFCNKLLAEKWPTVKRYGDIRDFLALAVASTDEIPPADIITGGDPCPCRSTAKGNKPSKHPDLAGYFLAVVGRLRPQWVVRENVPSPDVKDFAAALEAIGYQVVAFALDARDFTSQSRRRQILVGCPRNRASSFKRALLDAADGFGFSSSYAEETTPIATCVTAHPARMAAEDSYVFESKTACITTCEKRYDDRDNFIFEPATFAITTHGDIRANNGGTRGNIIYQGGRLRVLTPEECETLQGFPRKFTSGFSRSRRRIMLGNAVPVPFAEFVAERIKEAVTPLPGSTP